MHRNDHDSTGDTVDTVTAALHVVGADDAWRPGGLRHTAGSRVRRNDTLALPTHTHTHTHTTTTTTKQNKRHAKQHGTLWSLAASTRLSSSANPNLDANLEKRRRNRSSANRVRHVNGILAFAELAISSQLPVRPRPKTQDPPNRPQHPQRVVQERLHGRERRTNHP